MKEFEELQQLWRKNIPESKVDFEGVMHRIEKGQKELAAKMWWHVIAFSVGLLILGYIWVTLAFVTWTSHLALVLVASSMIYALLVQWKSYQNVKQINFGFTQKPEEYIQNLKAFKANRYRQHSHSFMIYETCIAVAFALYSFELYFALPAGTFIGMVVFIIFWFIISHFVFLKAYIQHENEKIQNMISDLDRIKNQFE